MTSSSCFRRLSSAACACRSTASASSFSTSRFFLPPTTPWKRAAVSSSTFGHLAICFPEQAMWLSTRPGLDHAKVRLQWLHVHVQPFWLPSSGLLSWISS